MNSTNKVFHIKRPSRTVMFSWEKVQDCKSIAELKTALEALTSNFKRKEGASKFGTPITVGEVIRGDKLRVYAGAKWVGIQWLKQNGICQ